MKRLLQEAYAQVTKNKRKRLTQKQYARLQLGLWTSGIPAKINTVLKSFNLLNLGQGHGLLSKA